MNTFLKETNELYKTIFTKEQYIVWKDDWKEHYKELSKSIREDKAKRKTVPYGYVYGLSYKRYQASQMMQWRKDMKEQAIMLKNMEHTLELMK
jgi:hypothetical protein